MKKDELIAFIGKDAKAVFIGNVAHPWYNADKAVFYRPFEEIKKDDSFQNGALCIGFYRGEERIGYVTLNMRDGWQYGRLVTAYWVITDAPKRASGFIKEDYSQAPMKLTFEGIYQEKCLELLEYAQKLHHDLVVGVMPWEAEVHPLIYKWMVERGHLTE